MLPATMEGKEEIEILIEWPGSSKEVVKISPTEVEAFIKSKLPSGSSHTPCLHPYDAGSPKVKGNYIMQKWSERWNCFVDSDKEICDGDRLTVVECDCEVGIISIPFNSIL